MDPLAQRLRSERERQGLTVRDLAIVTKIREPYIEAIERGRYDVLPAVYVRSFVRTLGGALGISVKQIADLMDEVFDLDGETPERLPRSKPTPPPSSPVLAETMQRASTAVSATVQKAGSVMSEGLQRAREIVPPTVFFEDRRRLLIIGGAVLALILAIALYMIFSGTNDDAASGILDRTSTEITVDSDGGGGTLDSILLTAEVVDSAWLTITMDGSRTRQLVLVPGEEYEWRADTTFILSLNNAGGVRFFRSGEPLPLFGQKGQAVRRVTITRTEVISSTKATTGQMPPTPAPSVQTPSAAPKPAPKPVSVAPATKPKQVIAQPAARPRRVAPAKQPVKQRVVKKQPSRRSMPMITPAPTKQPTIRPSTPPEN